ncbi:TPA: hypothetical protein NU718_000370 [Acinetobacter baumannii]|nr:hypothetical protein [Acinetobacter baumannii]
MDKCREEFEKQKFLSFYLANLVFDETENKYKPNEELIRTGEDWEWQAFRNQSVVVNTAWAAWQHQQAKVEELQKRIDKALKIQDEFDDQDDVRLMMYAVEQALKGEG